MVKTIQFPIDDELWEKIMGLKNRKQWSWVDCVEELLKRCGR